MEKIIVIIVKNIKTIIICNEKELSKKRINGLILFIDILLIFYIVAVILAQIFPEFKEVFGNLLK